MSDWLTNSQYLVAFITGLLGGVHCFGMCGGIVGALSLLTPSEQKIKNLNSQLILIGL